MKHILLATDGSPSSERAADVAGDLAKAFEAPLTVLTVGGGESAFKEAVRELVAELQASKVRAVTRENPAGRRDSSLSGIMVCLALRGD